MIIETTEKQQPKADAVFDLDIFSIAVELAEMKAKKFRGCYEIHFNGSGAIRSVRANPTPREIGEVIRAHSR